MILLVSDGFSSDLDGGNDMEIAKQLRANGITVYAVHIAETEIPPQIVNITAYTGGEVFNPGDVEGLKAIFQRIDAMQQAELEKTIAETLDNYFPFCVAGLSVLGLSVLSLFGVRYTPW
jgi:Ca-activated chloride channel family protein